MMFWLEMTRKGKEAVAAAKRGESIVARDLAKSAYRMGRIYLETGKAYKTELPKFDSGISR